ncbi:MAG: TIGR02206 family membrane protein [Ardenticatenaceae bacterium]|nr:TIGR02206 family membrane protein [Ardenticatenaceae bacterium]
MFTNRQFVFLSREHLIPFWLTIGLAVGLPIWAIFYLSAVQQLWLVRLLSLIVSASVVGWIAIRMRIGEFTIQTDLPLDICNILALFLPVLLWQPNPLINEPLYYIILAGTIQGIFTPNLYEGFPHFTFIKYWITHSGLIIVILYTTVVFGLFPTAAGIWRTAAVVLAYAGILYVINLSLNANYMYLRHKPPRQTLLDWLGQWPWYILTATGVMFMLFGLLYLPFLFLAP